jgi:hypothetical protein
MYAGRLSSIHILQREDGRCHESRLTLHSVMMKGGRGNAWSGPHAAHMNDHGLHATIRIIVKGTHCRELVWAAHVAGHNAWAVHSNLKWWPAACSSGS